MKDENYYVVQGWMVNRLKLKGMEKDLFAIIYGFSQDGETEFTGSLSYLCEATGSTKPTVMKALTALQEKKYLIKRSEIINKVTFNRYKVNLQVVKNLYHPGKETCMGGSKETLPNNIAIDKLEDNTEISTNVDAKKEKRFKRPSFEEVAMYCCERKNNIDAQYFLDYYDAKGWMIGKNHIKDWKACVRTWERNRKPSYSKGGSSLPKYLQGDNNDDWEIEE